MKGTSEEADAERAENQSIESTALSGLVSFLIAMADTRQEATEGRKHLFQLSLRVQSNR